MSATIHYGGRVLATGDSIATPTYWPPTAMDAVDAMIPVLTGAATVVGRAATVVGAAATVSPSYHPVIVRLNTAVPGSVVSDITANFAARVSSQSPDVIWYYIGVNNLPGSAASFTADYDALLAATRAWSSTVPIICCDVFAHGELWAAGPVWNNADDPRIAEYCAAIQALCVTYNATYVPLRDQALAYEALHNPIPSASGILTIDGIHPSADGITMISNAVVAACSVVP